MEHIPGFCLGKALVLVFYFTRLTLGLQCVDEKAPCINNATCLTFNNGTEYCRCAPGYLGEYCQHKDPCQPGYCLNGGNCSVSMSAGVPVPGSTSCTCPLGYTGQRCQTPQNSTCYPNNPCANKGVCTLLSLVKYKCECTRGWTGQHCTEDVDECRLQPNTCQNGGTCSNLIGGYVCVCVNGWSGPDCSENIDDCSTAACSQGSTCIDRVASFICVCPPGKTGLLCHRDDACISNPCREGSHCDTNPITGMFNCNCPPGYIGNTCNRDRDECSIGPNPCEHGGQCVNTDGSFTCNCVKGYSGPRCEQDVNEGAPTPA
ncbi:neurogenic locus notch homolog protein 1-like [Xiphophorus maculatus]|uniref:neurogenic locus notch homolog protein 1-like n=1 Tax=Xiphophorus maculatus TaxID=8083 RepID=UPI000C6E1389|nr:neurogenic locus notch homolog protein 1-like [Xiphophorus maculatus]